MIVFGYWSGRLLASPRSLSPGGVELALSSAGRCARGIPSYGSCDGSFLLLSPRNYCEKSVLNLLTGSGVSCSVGQMRNVETSRGTFHKGQKVRYGSKLATVVGFGINRNGTRTLQVQFTAHGETFTDTVLVADVEAI